MLSCEKLKEFTINLLQSRNVAYSKYSLVVDDLDLTPVLNAVVFFHDFHGARAQYPDLLIHLAANWEIVSLVLVIIF